MAQRGRPADLQSVSSAHSHFRYRGLWQLPEEARSPPKAATGLSRSLNPPGGRPRTQTNPDSQPHLRVPVCAQRLRNFSGAPSPASPPGPESGLSQGPPLHTAWRCQPGVGGMSAAAGLGGCPKSHRPRMSPAARPGPRCPAAAGEPPASRVAEQTGATSSSGRGSSSIKGRTPPQRDIPDAPTVPDVGGGCSGAFLQAQESEDRQAALEEETRA